MTDISVLITRWRAGDERAAEALYNHYRQPTFQLACGMLGDPNDAEEAAQDALTYVLINIGRYDPQRASFGTWLHTITVSRCRDRQRRRRRRLPQLSLTAWLKRGGEVRDSIPTQERQAIQAETRSQVWKTVQNLNPPLREAILLRYWAGHTYREIAEITGCPIRTAQSRVRLAYQQLRTALTQDSLVDLDDLGEESMR